MNFPHHKLDAFGVAREAMVRGTKLANALPRGYGTLADQLRRALLGAYLQLAEGAARWDADRRARFRAARGEACEAAAGIEALQVLMLASEPECNAVIALLDRLAAMLTALARGP